MLAAVYEAFGQPLVVRSVPDPEPADDGVVVRVEANGICRSDWHGWMGHDPDIRLPHVPGHELVGTVDQVGRRVVHWRVGDRVTVPFCCGCGQCPPCRRGQTHVCRRYFQPGFTAWGAFAQRVALRYADTNLVRLPAEVDAVAAASLGCRFATAYRAVVQQARLQRGEWLAVFGCGGVGLSAVMIAALGGVRTVAIDVSEEKLQLAAQLGATATLLAEPSDSFVERIAEVTDGGPHATLDALGSQATCAQAIRSLREQGCHVQVGLLVGRDLQPRLPMERVIARELRIVGSHGLPAAAYPALLDLVASGLLDPKRLVRQTVPLDQAGEVLQAMADFTGTGITVIDRFG